MNNLSGYLKRILLLLIIVCCCGIVGQILLFLVYLLPTDAITANIGRGADALLVQGAEYNYAEDYRESILDNETDAVMLSETLFHADSSIYDSVMVPRYNLSGNETQILSLMASINGDDLTNANISVYPRYWHGYLIILKPFFLLFDYSDFKIINQAIQMVIIFIVFYLLIRLNLSKYLIGFVAMFVFWNPATIGVSLQYAACFYISMIGCIIVLARDIRNEWLLFVFLGIATSYFDFLTYPLVTFGLPMTLLLLKNSNEIKKPILSIVQNGITWSFGYLGMWLSKWVIGTILSGENVILDAANNVSSRSSNMVDGEKISRLFTVYRLIQATFFKWPYLLMILGMCIYLIIMYRGKFHTSKKAVGLLMMALLPIIWFLVTANHSYIHPRLVYRSWGVTILALTSIVPICSGDKEYEQ